MQLLELWKVFRRSSEECRKNRSIPLKLARKAAFAAFFLFCPVDIVFLFAIMVGIAFLPRLEVSVSFVVQGSHGTKILIVKNRT